MEEFEKLTGIKFDFLGDDGEHLEVTLSPPAPPAQTNGQWDETNKFVFWDCQVEPLTNHAQLPVLCYANWSQPCRDFPAGAFLAAWFSPGWICWGSIAGGARRFEPDSGR